MPTFICRPLWIITLAVLIGTGAPLAHAQPLTTEKDVQTHLQQEGYQQIRDIKFTKDGITANAMKDGQPVSLIMDPTGKVKPRQ